MGVASDQRPDWPAVADAFCAAWSSERGTPDFEARAELYLSDDDTVVIYDSLPPLEGFRGFAEMRRSIYDGLARLAVSRAGPVAARVLAGGQVAVLSYPLRFAYAFQDGRELRFDARISQVWERIAGRYRIVHEHPSTVLDNAAS